jgi:hypothetical protein
MNITRIADAPTYVAPPDHHGMTCLRLQGHEAGPASALWLGLSHILPGGGITLGASPLEKHYIVLDGAVTVITETGETGEATLSRWDSVRLAPGEARALVNRTDVLATIMLAMPLAP